MPIHFRCPNCAKLLALGARHSGTQIHCPMCDRLITVPPRTQVQMPTTTVVMPDVPQDWWMDAPPVLPPQAEPLPQPPPAADAWWLTTNAPLTPPEKTISSQPPPLPQALAPSPAAEPPTANNPIVSARSFPRWLLFLLAACVLLAAIVAILLLLSRGANR